MIKLQNTKDKRISKSSHKVLLNKVTIRFGIDFSVEETRKPQNIFNVSTEK